jgi:hypothetical protein
MESNCLLVSHAVLYWTAFFLGIVFFVPTFFAQEEFRVRS